MNALDNPIRDGYNFTRVDKVTDKMAARHSGYSCMNKQFFNEKLVRGKYDIVFDPIKISLRFVKAKNSLGSADRSSACTDSTSRG